MTVKRLVLLCVFLTACGTAIFEPKDPIPGTNGVAGDKGEPGKDGSTGVDGAKGQQGDVGPQGEIGLPGVSGNDGIDGVNGIDGIGGVNGTDGTVVTPVVLCPDVSGTYPEVLLCINNRLYSAYTDKKGRTRYREAIPGSYYSSDSRECSFTVVSGCDITYP